MNTRHEKIHQLLESALSALNYELVGFELLTQGKYTLLRVYIDTPTGVTVDHCVEASRQIGALLDVEDPIKTQYHLEVSSPGLNRPLFKTEHYAKFIGHGVRIKLKQPINNQRNIAGRILQVLDSEITIQGDTEKNWVLRVDDIEKANLIAEL